MAGDPLFSFRRSLPLLIFSILDWKNKQDQKKKIVGEKLKIFRLFYSRMAEVFSVRTWTGKTIMYSVSRSILPQRTTSAPSVYLIDLLVVNWTRLPDLNFTNLAPFTADSRTLRSSLNNKSFQKCALFQKRAQKLIFALLHGKSLKICRWEHLRANVLN